MRITIEQVENGYLVIYETQQGRKVFIVDKASGVVDFIKSIVDPSPILVKEKPIATAV
jgi:hypothetical protein